jgi:hypothetical protein
MENMDNLIDEIKTISLIQHLKEYILENTPNEKIYNLINECNISLPIYTDELRYDQDIYIYRMVPNKCEKFLSKKGRISYNPTGKANRCNIENKPVFYGTLELRKKNDKIVDPISVCSNELQIEENEIVTIGTWKVKKSFEYCLIFPKSKEIEFIEEFKKQYKNNKLTTMVLNDYLREEMGKEVKKGEEYEYKITAAFSNIVFDKGQNIKAIAYPSTKLGEGIGYNIAIKKETIDGGCLELINAGTYKSLNNQLHLISKGTINDNGTIDYIEIVNN